MTSLFSKASEIVKSLLPKSVEYSDRYIEHIDGTISDINTGLTWMRCALGQEWDGTSCIGTASRHAWNEAMACGHTFAGHNNWRVPNIEELQGLGILSRDSLNAYLSFFPKAPTSDYWSSTIGRKDLDSVKYLALPSGNVCFSHKNSSRHLRLVRDTNAIVEDAIMKPELGKSIEIARMAANLAKPVKFRETTASGAGYPEYTNNNQNNVSVSDRAQTRDGMDNNKVASNTVADKNMMLIKASKYGMKSVLIRLLDNGANINHMDALGLAPLDYAICCIPCDYVPVRSWPLFRARELMQHLMESFTLQEK